MVLYFPLVPGDYKYHKEAEGNTAVLTEIDVIDREIMSLITKGFSSSYSIWSAMKKEVKEKNLDRKVMTYRNTNKRVVRLSRLGLLEEIKPDVYSSHGKRDYKLTMKGLEQLVPYILDHPEAVANLTTYLDKMNLDKYQFGVLLKEKYTSATQALNVYDLYTNSLYYPFRITDPDMISDWINEHQDVYKKDKKIHNEMIAAHNEMNADMLNVIHAMNIMNEKFKNIEDKEKTQQMTKIEIENNKRIIPETEIIPTTNSLEVAREIRQVIERHNKKYDKLGADPVHGGDPYAQELLAELDLSIKKYRPEIADEKISIIDKTKKILDETVAAANETADSFRQTVMEMKERAPDFQETIKHTHSRKKKPI